MTPSWLVQQFLYSTICLLLLGSAQIYTLEVNKRCLVWADNDQFFKQTLRVRHLKRQREVNRNPPLPPPLQKLYNLYLQHIPKKIP